MGFIYIFFGFIVGYIMNEMLLVEKKVVYNCDIIYVIVKEVGFDFLRFIGVFDDSEWLFCFFNYVIVDEVDVIMIDEVWNFLVIVGCM